ncbi:abortive phage infection protein [Mucilaginibacter terrigena]|uniref:Abortive phage infection protein n=1 Tax=Mucilaginibacter terrigena TaxID=2492395 RepID=A0A4Q5LML1_9SPHI|nr:AIPR family protein [Mucilaginibacter terrigena]RYU90928.1 abortive phage infection protein [Mucilaginibacter terrigena]
MIDINYPNLLQHIEYFLVPGKRSESASFLMWYLENYYRLDKQEAIDCVCDQNGDKGIDGIYVNEAYGTIDIFQSKISQSANRTIGDVALKEFYGSLSQLRTKDSIENLINTGGDAQVVGLIKRLNLLQKVEAYKLRGIFLSNIDIDKNGEAFLTECQEIEFEGRSSLESTFISSSRKIPDGTSMDFDIQEIDISKYYADANTITYIIPLKSTELVQMPGISDQSIFDYNVRGPLGNTNVNKGIVSSIRNPALHKKFPLFHNGITIVSNKVTTSDTKLKIETFFVVNGCQSLTALFNNRQYLSDDLRILTKIIQVPVDSELSAQITEYSNSQNGVKARDFKSYNPIQIRLQNEFSHNYGNEYYYEIKRGELTPSSIKVISNEEAGILLMSFDLKEPWGTHRKYQVFEDLYVDIFARPEVNSDRILMLKLIDDSIIGKIGNINNQLIAKYSLTRFAIVYFIRIILENDEVGKDAILHPQTYVREKLERTDFIACINRIIDDIVVDLNMEVDELSEDFDYKSRLRDENWVNNLSKNIVGAYLKLVKSGRLGSFSKEWSEKTLNRNNI